MENENSKPVTYRLPKAKILMAVSFAAALCIAPQFFRYEGLPTNDIVPSKFKGKVAFCFTSRTPTPYEKIHLFYTGRAKWPWRTISF